MSNAISPTRDYATAAAPSRDNASSISVLTLGWSLSVFFVISFLLCVLGYYLVPSFPVTHGALAVPLPGFQFDSWPRFILGLAESFAWGWYVAILFGPLYNWFGARFR